MLAPLGRGAPGNDRPPSPGRLGAGGPPRLGGPPGQALRPPVRRGGGSRGGGVLRPPSPPVFSLPRPALGAASLPASPRGPCASRHPRQPGTGTAPAPAQPPLLR